MNLNKNEDFLIYVILIVVVAFESYVLAYLLNPWSNLFVTGNEMSFVFVVISCLTIEFFIRKAKNGEEIYLMPISVMSAMEEAVGRAT